jgi:hypothetical protein
MLDHLVEECGAERTASLVEAALERAKRVAGSPSRLRAAERSQLLAALDAQVEEARARATQAETERHQAVEAFKHDRISIAELARAVSAARLTWDLYRGLRAEAEAARD